MRDRGGALHGILEANGGGMSPDQYLEHDGLGLAELVRQGSVSAAELLEVSITRIERLNPTLNAVIHPMFEQARRAVAAGVPDGPFAGVPFVVKDIIAMVAGEPQRNGSRYFEGWAPDHDSELIARYRRAGLVIVGKTNTPEFGLTPYTEPALFGPTRNPWDAARTAGGSSGGTAAAVASGMVPLGHGNDGGGSIRIPAAACGLFGLKPSRGRNPLGPDFSEFWYGFVAEHVLTRSVRDSAAMLDATAGLDAGAPYAAPAPARPFLQEVGAPPGRLRIAWTAKPFLGDSVDAHCVAALERTVRLLEELGHEVVEAAPVLDGERFGRAFMVMLCGQLAADLRLFPLATGKRVRRRDFEVETWALALLGRSLSADLQAAAVTWLQMESRRISAWCEQFDVLLTPTLASPPPVHGALRPPAWQHLALDVVGRLGAGTLLKLSGMLGDAARQAFGFIPWTPVFNATGQPAMSVPLEWTDDGLPIGMHFVARYGDEATLFRLASQLEGARPWFHRRPALG